MTAILNLPVRTQTYTGPTNPISGIGVNGDLYINTSTGVLYIKISGSWQSAGFGGILQLVSMDTTTRDALTPSAGLVIFNTTTASLEYYDGNAWI